VLRGFAFTMLIGVITGTYASIFVASAIAYDWLHRGNKDVIEAAGAPKARTASKPRMAATA
jgi:SecD/SecF fusion protein